MGKHAFQLAIDGYTNNNIITTPSCISCIDVLCEKFILRCPIKLKNSEEPLNWN